MGSSRLLIIGSLFAFAVGCGADGPYKSKKAEISTKLAAIRSAVRLVDASSAVAGGRPPPTALTPPVVVGNPRAGELVNATVLQAELLPSIGTGKQFKHDFVATDGSWCLAEAASVVEQGKFIEETEGHKAASSRQCADFILRLRYLVVVKTRVLRRAESSSSASFEGSASLVDLDATAPQKILTTFAIKTDERGEVSAPHIDKNGQSYAVLLKGANDPTVAAESVIETELAARFTGSKMIRDDFK